MYLVTIFQAFLARSLFFTHSFVTIWRCADVLQDSKLWLITLANVALVIETLYTCFKRKGHEWKWFSPAICIYLCAAVPPIWFLELDRLEKFKQAKDGSNATAISETLSAIQGIEIPIALPANLWVTILEQLLLLTLIVGRWIMPKGEISRDALSQLLFVYIGMSSDIMELFVLFEEEKLVGNTILSYVILTFWTISLIQFCFVLTATKNPKRARISVKQPEGGKQMAGNSGCCEKWLTTEAWSICVSLFMQDGPFLCIRMFTIVKYQVITYNTIFFTCKNILVTMLLLYRMCVICSTDKDESDKVDEKVKVRRTTLIKVSPSDDALENGSASEFEEVKNGPSKKVFSRSQSLTVNNIGVVQRKAVNQSLSFPTSADPLEDIELV